MIGRRRRMARRTSRRTARRTTRRVNRRQAMMHGGYDQPDAYDEPVAYEAPAAVPPAQPEENKYDELAKIKQLRDDGVLTQEEFEAEKAKILG